MDQHDHAVGGRPGVRLEAVDPGLEGVAEGSERVLRVMGTGAPVGEGDRRHGTSRAWWGRPGAARTARALCLKEPRGPADALSVTSIKADCPRCGAVRLGPPDVTVRVCIDDGAGSYRFRCPTCTTAAVHEASPAICALLRQAGCEEEIWTLARGARLSDAVGPAFTADDLLDFHLLLSGDDWESALHGLATRVLSRTPTTSPRHHIRSSLRPPAVRAARER